MKVYGRTLADALHRSGARIQPLNESSHHYGDVERMRQMLCGASATLGPNRDAGGKQERYHGEVRRGDSTSVQKTEVGQRP